MATSAQRIETKRTGAPSTGLIIAVILAIAGIAAWVYQVIYGMRVTGLNQQVVWGLYIAAFFTAVGAGASLLALAGLSEFRSVLPVADRTKVLSLALASFIAGGLLIAMDVGNPVQLWRLVAGLRFTSFMTWDFWLLAAAGVIALVYLLVSRAGRPNKVLGVLGILAGVAVVVAEGWMLSTLAARHMWGEGLVLVSFLLGSVIAGLSLGLVARFAPEKMANWLAYALGMGLVLVLADVLTGLLAGGREEQLLLFGSAAPAFWFHLVVGVLLPLVLLVNKSNLPLAGVLALVGVLAEKVWLLSAGQALPWLALPEGSYFPSWVEFVAVIGMVALGALVYMLIDRLTARRQAPGIA